MAVTNYFCAEGEIFAEKTVGQARLDYVPDALGSVKKTTDQSRTVQYAGDYTTPYGQVASISYNAPRFTWVGTRGYQNTQGAGMPHTEYYVRARYYGSAEGRWTTMDSLWPAEFAYGYVRSNPTSLRDATGRGGGTAPSSQDVPPPQAPPVDVKAMFHSSCTKSIPAAALQGWIDLTKRLCDAVEDPASAKSREIRKCLSAGDLPVVDLIGGDDPVRCLRERCRKKDIVLCDDGNNTGTVYTYGVGSAWPCDNTRATYRDKASGVEFKAPYECASTVCDERKPKSAQPGSATFICSYWLTGLEKQCPTAKVGDWCGTRGPKGSGDASFQRTLIHEFIHACGSCGKIPGNAHTIPLNNAAACIIGKI